MNFNVADQTGSITEPDLGDRLHMIRDWTHHRYTAHSGVCWRVAIAYCGCWRELQQQQSYNKEKRVGDIMPPLFCNIISLFSTITLILRVVGFGVSFLIISPETDLIECNPSRCGGLYLTLPSVNMSIAAYAIIIHS
jgi:hypothetical protein